MDYGFATDDAYNIYDKGLFTAQSTMNTLYRQKNDVDDEMYGEKMYKSRTHLRLLKEWQPVDAVIQRLEGTGFDLVHRINMDYRMTIDFLLALIDHYSVDLSCFIIGDQRITPTLDDVARITGFPIDGLPILGRDYKANECPNICNELLLSPELLHPKNRCDVILRKLLPFKNIPPF
ncbi:MAIN-LIKE 1-like [Olea europaea subsp. europaea]|uniref:MAIN-LIKE 1-like n=1 Tax=Olea europaea subsp. europaea TaxID=158383 RepID=A0A8S0PZ95_OLEEU|nr:MAIN-LIKE 1-like [Olea europaea subsp. europaea]